LKYRFQYVDKIPRPWRVAAMAFGTSVHAAVEWFHRERMEGSTPTLEAMLQVFEADWYAQNTEPLVFNEKESQDSLRLKAAAMLEAYLAASHGPAPAAVEQFFELDLADPETGEVFDLRLRGVIDLIEEGDVLVDLKTAGRMLEAGGLERHLQLSTYALALYLRTGVIPKLRLDMLLKTAKPRLERLETSRSREDLAWVAQLIKEVASAIETEHFFPNPSWRCSECEYFAHCQAWRGWTPTQGAIPAAAGGEGAGAAVA
ncbi:MAG TPA: PD-(D/E)XK nuclease family protein, partial [Gemmatimonadales bacterium]|nr:PD-(D/E)XK nuclease family protein [Gemmatimonadales bacterium]